MYQQKQTSIGGQHICNLSTVQLILLMRLCPAAHLARMHAAGGGAYYADWFYANWAMDCPEVLHMHINLKEIFTVFLASIRWAKAWRNQHIIVYSDNMATVHMINKGSTKNTVVMDWLRHLFWLSAVYNFHLNARHVKGVDNGVSDFLSRLVHSKPNIWKVFIVSQGLDTNIDEHLSHCTLNYLLQSRNGKTSDSNC